MKGKISLKTVITFAILILVIILLVVGVNVTKTIMSGATADYEPQGLSAVSSADGSTATISWTTDKATTASVFYGTNVASLLLMAEDASETLDHKILLTNLRSGTAYYYKVVVGDNTYDNSGAMFSFKTTGSEKETVAVTPTIAPVVTLPVASTISATPTTTATSSATTSCSQTIDYNKDGETNSLDYISCLRGKITPTKTVTK